MIAQIALSDETIDVLKGLVCIAGILIVILCLVWVFWAFNQSDPPGHSRFNEWL